MESIWKRFVVYNVLIFMLQHDSRESMRLIYSLVAAKNEIRMSPVL